MKKVAAIMAMAVVLFTSACKKDENGTEVAAAATGSWTLGTNTYKVAFSNKGLTGGGNPVTLIIFADDANILSSNVHTLNLSFKTSPTTSGTYQLVGSVGGNLTSNQFELNAGSPAGVYVYLGAPVNVDVTVSGGKVKVVIPEITVKSSNSAQSDLKLSAILQEK